MSQGGAGRYPHVHHTKEAEKTKSSDNRIGAGAARHQQEYRHNGRDSIPGAFKNQKPSLLYLFLVPLKARSLFWQSSMKIDEQREP